MKAKNADQATLITVTVKASGATDGPAGSRKLIAIGDIAKEQLERYATRLGIDVDIVASQPFVFSPDPNPVIQAWIDAAALQLTDQVGGAIDDPVKARIHEMERRQVNIERKLDQLLVSLQGGAKTAPAVLQPQPRAHVIRVPKAEGASHVLAEPEVDHEPEVDDGSAAPLEVQRAAEKQGLPLIQRRAAGGRREQLDELKSTQMSLVGPAAKSEIITVDPETGDFVSQPLPRVGDTLRSLADQSDL